MTIPFISQEIISKVVEGDGFEAATQFNKKQPDLLAFVDRNEMSDERKAAFKSGMMFLARCLEEYSRPN